MLRGLKTSDIFKMSKILKKMGLKIDADKEKTQVQLGAEVILSIFENIHLAENEVNEFLADLCGMKTEEFSELPIEKTMEIIKEFKQIQGVLNFLKLANQ
jgi:hypothetical protein